MPRGGYREPRWVAQITEEITKEREAREAKEALLPPKVGINPLLPWHPVLNAEPVHQEEEENWVVALERREREKAKCVAEWETALELIKAGRFPTRGSLAKHFGKPRNWAYEVVRLMVRQAALTADEVKKYLPGRHK